MPTFIAYIDVGGTLCPSKRSQRHNARQWTVPQACLEAMSKLHEAGGHLVMISRGDRTDDYALATVRAQPAHWQVCYQLGIDPRP
eukprot:548223-Karenia_brevis.AAC.1